MAFLVTTIAPQNSLWIATHALLDCPQMLRITFENFPKQTWNLWTYRDYSHYLLLVYKGHERVPTTWNQSFKVLGNKLVQRFQLTLVHELRQNKIKGSHVLQSIKVPPLPLCVRNTKTYTVPTRPVCVRTRKTAETDARHVCCDAGETSRTCDLQCFSFSRCFFNTSCR